MISFAELSYTYAGKASPALHNIDLEIPQGSLFALLGPNGAGKTTLLRILCGRLNGYRGSLQLPAEWTTTQGALDPRKYGVLIENPGVYGRLSVLEYLQFFASFYAIVDAKSRIHELAARFALENLAQRMNTLSLGMRQKVQVMRAFLQRAPLILLDEPSSNLDPLAREEVWNLVRETNQQEGTTFIVCSHLLAEMESNATHLGLINQGSLITSGSLDVIRARHSGSTEVSIYFAQTVESTQSIEAFLGALLPAQANLRVEALSLHYVCRDPLATNPGVIAALVGRGIPLAEVHLEKPNLSDIYRKLISEIPKAH